MTYSEQIKSPLWQKKRLEVMQRDGYTCQSCGSVEKQLHVHHCYYNKGVNIWEYEDGELITLCKSCHEIVSEDVSDIIRRIRSISTDTGSSGALKKIINALDDIGMCDVVSSQDKICKYISKQGVVFRFNYGKHKDI